MFNSVLHGETLRWLLGQLMSQDPLFVTEAHVVFTSRATSLRGLFIFSNSLGHSRGISTPQSRSNPPRIISLWLYGRVNPPLFADTLRGPSFRPACSPLTRIRSSAPNQDRPLRRINTSVASEQSRLASTAETRCRRFWTLLSNDRW